MNIFKYITLELEERGESFDFFKEEEQQLFKELLEVCSLEEKSRIKNRLLTRVDRKESIQTICEHVFKALQEHTNLN